MKLFNRLVYWRRWRIARELLALYGVEIPKQIEIGSEFELVHRGFGTVIHPSTRIGNRVSIYHQVTTGRADGGFVSASNTKMEGIVIEDDVILFPGCKILCKDGVLTIRKGSIVAANAVLLSSTGEGEIWAGVPAKRVSTREGFSTAPAQSHSRSSP